MVAAHPSCARCSLLWYFIWRLLRHPRCRKRPAVTCDRYERQRVRVFSHSCMSVDKCEARSCAATQSRETTRARHGQGAFERLSLECSADVRPPDSFLEPWRILFCSARIEVSR